MSEFRRDLEAQADAPTFDQLFDQHAAMRDERERHLNEEHGELWNSFLNQPSAMWK